MFKRFLEKLTLPKVKLPTVRLSVPKISFRLANITFPKITFPSITFPKIVIPFSKIAVILGAINTTLLVGIGSLGLFISYINPIPWIASYISLALATELFDSIVLLQLYSLYTIITSATLIIFGLALHVANFKVMTIVHAPISAYRKLAVWRNWMLAKVEYANNESAKWKTTFKILMSPYSFLRMMGFSPQMAIGLLAVGSTAAGGVAVNETILAERSFSNGDSGIYAAPAQNPSTTLEETMAWRKENKDDNTLRIVLADTPVREIRIENVSVGTVYANSAMPANQTTAVLVGGVDVAGENTTDTFLEVGELIIEKSRCQTMDFTLITAHTINIVGNASDGQSINTTPGTSRMRAIGGGHHQAEAMVTSGGSFDRIHIDAPTSAKNGKIGKLILSNLYTEGGACTFTRMKVGTMTVELNEVGLGNGFATKELVIAQTVTAANWNVTDNVEVAIGVPAETLTNE